MEKNPNNLEDMCRRQWRLRTDAIRQAVDRRREALAEAGGTLSDREKLARDSVNRMLRAKGLGGVEGK